jgi:hypothetical protein
MSTSAHQNDPESREDAGSSADQHITGAPETGSFLTDEPPGDTPAHGSSNVVFNEAEGNHPDRMPPPE